MSHKIMLTYFLTALYLVSCSHSSSNYSVSPQPDITQSQIRLSATVEVSYTQTAVVLPSTTPTTSATIDLTKSIPIVLTDATIPTTPSNFRLHPDARLEINCLEIASDLPKHNKLAGMFVFSPTFEDQFQEEKPDAYLLVAETGEKIIITIDEQEIFGRFSVSPNYRWLVYEKALWDEQNKIMDAWLVVVDARGNEEAIIQLQENEWSTGIVIFWGGDDSFQIPNWSGYWLDNEHLIIVQESRFGKDKLRLINVLTGETQVLPANVYPNQDISPIIDNLWTIPTIYDPSLRWVIYQALIGNEHPLIVWDRQTDGIVTEITSFTPNPIAKPAWSADGSQFIFVIEGENRTKHELYQYIPGGQLTRLTFFTEVYEEARISNFSWSPDGQKIAFWLTTSDNPEHYYLAILDLESLWATNTCIRGFWNAQPIWSPDGKQLLIESPDEYYEHDYLVLVDIAQYFAVNLMNTDGIDLVGWLINSK